MAVPCFLYGLFLYYIGKLHLPSVLLPVGFFLIVVQGGERPDPVIDLLVVVEAVAEGPSRLHLSLRPCIVVVLGEFLHQGVELVGELHAGVERGKSFYYLHQG